MGLTPLERAEKIAKWESEEISGTPQEMWKEKIKFIVAQLREAEKEAYTKGFHEGQAGLYERGRVSMREEAAKVAEKACEDSGECIVHEIAERIRGINMEKTK